MASRRIEVDQRERRLEPRRNVAKHVVTGADAPDGLDRNSASGAPRSLSPAGRRSGFRPCIIGKRRAAERFAGAIDTSSGRGAQSMRWFPSGINRERSEGFGPKLRLPPQL